MAFHRYRIHVTLPALFLMSDLLKHSPIENDVDVLYFICCDDDNVPYAMMHCGVAKYNKIT